MPAKPQEPGRLRAPSDRTIDLLCQYASADDIGRTIAEMLQAKLSNGAPDWRGRESGCKLWLAYCVGLPVQRIEETQTRVNVQIDPEKLLSNPASLEAIARKLQGTDAGARLLAELSKPRQAQGTVIEQGT